MLSIFRECANKRCALIMENDNGNYHHYAMICKKKQYLKCDFKRI